MAPFYENDLTVASVQRGNSLLLTTKFPEVPGTTHLTDLGRMKGLFELAAI